MNSSLIAFVLEDNALMFDMAIVYFEIYSVVYEGTFSFK